MAYRRGSHGTYFILLVFISQQVNLELCISVNLSRFLKDGWHLMRSSMNTGERIESLTQIRDCELEMSE